MPTWYGHSVGHWEGDTLVVETVGFNDKFWFDFVGHPHTTQLHDGRALHAHGRRRRSRTSITIDDPGAYTKPFTVKFTATPAARLRS